MTAGSGIAHSERSPGDERADLVERRVVPPAGIVAVVNSDYLVNELLFSNLDAWGWFFIVYGAIQCAVGVGVAVAGGESGDAKEQVSGPGADRARAADANTRALPVHSAAEW